MTWQNRILRACTLCVAIAISTVPDRADAIDFERLIMPGPVSQAHAETENDCSKCHSPFDTGREETLCIDCHEEVGQDRQSRSGFHGRDRGASHLPCRDCHTEHKGREHDILGLDGGIFDHGLTDFPLQGAHMITACNACHADDQLVKKYRETPSQCVDCHEKDDRHQESLGRECGDCHSEASWAEAKFDHAKTEFPLAGAHETTACSRCHTGTDYKAAPTKCIGCHQLDDVHQGRFGNDCARCHGETDFKKSQRFDHAAETKFPLRGLHEKITCEACHVEPAEKVKLAMDCLSCHAARDSHRGLLGPKCEDCHSEQGWKETRFDHDRDSRFPLAGRHRELACETCHRDTPTREATLAECKTCHENDDVHGDQLGGDCDRCHESNAWSRDLFFEHDLARFPLLGMHAAVACDGCHATMRFRDAELTCTACHESDDTHEGGLGSQCAQCHNPNGWTLWRFDHDRQTHFALEGEHQGLACHACHKASLTGEVRTSSECESCHARDDAHRGRFGNRCETCHDARSWKNARMPR